MKLFIKVCIKFHASLKVFPIKILQGESLANWLFSSTWQKKVWQINRQANRLLIVRTNLYGFSLVDHRRFTKFAKLSPRQTFLLYGNSPKVEILF